MGSCANCGGANEEAARFCVHCGSRLSPTTTRGASQRRPAAQPQQPKSKRGSRKRQRQATLLGTPRSEGPPAHSMSEALEGALAAVGAPATTTEQPSEPPPSAPPQRRPALPPSAEFAIIAPAPEPLPQSESPVPIAAPRPAAPPPVAAAAMPEPVPSTQRVPEPVPVPAAGRFPASNSEPPPEIQLAPSSAPPSDGLHLEQVLAGIDDGFDAIVRGGGDAPVSSGDLSEPTALFEQIAATQLHPVRDFLVELRMGEPPKDWVQLCLPTMTSLRKAAESMGLIGLCAAIDGFLPALQHVADSPENFVGGVARDELLSAYGALAAQLPGAFALDEERDRREPIIVQSLLSQVKGVRAVALDKIYSAGLTSLAMFLAAKPEDVAAATGLPLQLCARIVQRFARYKAETVDVAPDAGRSREQQQLFDLLSALRRQNDAFQAAADSGATSDKRRLRRDRADTMLKVNVVLARLGEVERLKQLERLPFERKVSELELIVMDLRSRHGASA